MMAVGSTKSTIYEFKTVRTRCSESNFDRMACDFKSCSLLEPISHPSAEILD